MGEASRMMGFLVIATLYTVIGVMSAAGSISISRRILAPKAEQIFYGIYLMPIAGFYLAFTVYFGMDAAWRVESAAVLAFVALGFVGIRVPFALLVGYPVHGLWNVLHTHGGFSAFAPGPLTAVPLAYGIFCATYDVCLAAYFYTRCREWEAGWASKSPMTTVGTGGGQRDAPTSAGGRGSPLFR